MTVRPLHDRLLIKRIEEKETVKGGIIIPDTAKEKPQEGEVIAVGRGKKTEEDVHKLWERLSGVYATQLALTPPERVLLNRLRGRWAETDMLDLGVGAGRTAYTFAAITRDYVGLDFAPGMIERARRAVPEDEHTHFAVQDVRDLSPWHGRGFGVVLFSFNGLDAVPPAPMRRCARRWASRATGRCSSGSGNGGGSSG